MVYSPCAGEADARVYSDDWREGGVAHRGRLRWHDFPYSFVVYLPVSAFVVSLPSLLI